uniref:long-chain fatty acid transport protein 4-like n=1 Tax=Styela clava TaxID=7725 RepID=UPI00193992A0|nr:long-chain fatty acid transport protein 4-like [Styela clava]
MRIRRFFRFRSSHLWNSKILKMMKIIAMYVVPLVISYWYITTSLILNAGVILGVYLLTGGWKFAEICVKTLRRDLFALFCLVRFKLYMARNIRRNRTVPVIFQDLARQHPMKVALQWENVKWTFSDLEEYSNAIAHHFSGLGLKRGDNVAIFVSSRPEFVALWLGLSKIGVVSALINFNLRGDALAHCINIAEAKAVIIDEGLATHIKDVRENLKGEMSYYTVCESSEKQNAGDQSTLMENAKCLDHVFKDGNRNPLPQPKDADYFDRLTYIYTSGTTGLPKAAVITHNRFIFMCTMPHYILSYKKDDILYCALPLYHSNGGIVGLGQCLIHGLTFAFRSKFSASNFWTDCIKYNATVILYIGEICRYLLAQPHKVTDKQHRVRLISGNGLRPEIWEEFVSRFNIAKVGEFYGATEGNANLINIDSKAGSCGFVSRIAPFAYPVKLMRVDDDSEFIRGLDGLCTPCQPREQGMIVGKIIKGSPTQGYVGYANESASQKKIVRDVLEKGDQYFISGDILEMDELGYMYFRDRTGDTFRWKGENVSTAECESRIAKVFYKKLTVAVYGVTIPLADGKAGMACIEDPEKTVDIEKLYGQLEMILPSYARPLFIRQTDAIEVTSTHKLKKVNLTKEGFDIHRITDPLYFFDSKQKKYVPLDPDLYNKVMDGTVRV